MGVSHDFLTISPNFEVTREGVDKKTTTKKMRAVSSERYLLKRKEFDKKEAEKSAFKQAGNSNDVCSSGCTIQDARTQFRVNKKGTTKKYPKNVRGVLRGPLLFPTLSTATLSAALVPSFLYYLFPLIYTL